MNKVNFESFFSISVLNKYTNVTSVNLFRGICCKSIFFGFTMLCGIAVNAQKNQETNRLSQSSQLNYFIDSIMEKMTIREKIGQTMLMLPNHSKELELGNGSLEGFFERYPVSGFFMGWKLFEGVERADYLSHIKKSTLAYQQASKAPLFFQQDYEVGVTLPGMTTFQTEMAVGATNSKQLAFDYGKSVAKESRSVGVNWVLHPLADLNMNPLNPITNIRSISDNPDKAIRLLSQQIKGLQSNGVAATIKHFPGDGTDYRDQHLTTTSNLLTLEQWHHFHGKVFKALIDSGVACIMPGHISFPAYQKEKLNGFYPPATLSKELLTNLLKGELGFKGMVVSDAMTMGGYRGYYPNQLEGEIHSFMAGVDVLLWPSYSFMDTLEAMVKNGKIPIERLNDAVKRVLTVKYNYGLYSLQKKLIREMSETEKNAAMETATKIAERSITLLRDRNKSLPLDTNKIKKILVVGVAPKSRKGGDGGLANLKELRIALQQQGFQVDFQNEILYEKDGWDEDISSRYDKIIIAIDRHPHAPFGPLELYDDQAQTAWGVNAMPKDKLIVISFGSPYLIDEYFDRVNTCINAYSNNPETHKAVARALVGKIPFVGVSPVKLGRPKFNLTGE